MNKTKIFETKSKTTCSEVNKYTAKREKQNTQTTL